MGFRFLGGFRHAAFIGLERNLKLRSLRFRSAARGLRGLCRFLGLLGRRRRWGQPRLATVLDAKLRAVLAGEPSYGRGCAVRTDVPAVAALVVIDRNAVLGDDSRFRFRLWSLAQFMKRRNGRA